MILKLQSQKIFGFGSKFIASFGIFIFLLFPNKPYPFRLVPLTVGIEKSNIGNITIWQHVP